MEGLAKKPNLLFLIAIRAPTFPLVVILGKQFTKIPFDAKLRKALVITIKIPSKNGQRSETTIFLPHRNKHYFHSFDDMPVITEQLGSDFSEHWYFMGVRHRDNGKPAYTYFNHSTNEWTFRWYKHGLENQDGDEPSSIYDAIYDSNGIRIKYDRLEYSKNGKKHREGGPALIDWNGSEQWFLNDVPHRLGGPAIVLHNTYDDSTIIEYWVHGIKYESVDPE